MFLVVLFVIAGAVASVFFDSMVPGLICLGMACGALIGQMRKADK